MRKSLSASLPDWAQEWLEIIVPAVHIVLILLTAWLLQSLLRRLLQRAGQRYQWPVELLMPIKGLLRWSIYSAALLLALERLGVSATVLWTAFTGFATVGAVAFFAAWSVLSNLFCALLIFTLRPFRPGDTIELLDTAEKPGAKGRVVETNLLYTSLQDVTEANAGALLQIPNALVFQRVLRRWPGGAAAAAVPAAAVPAAAVPAAAALHPTAAQAVMPPAAQAATPGTTPGAAPTA